MPEQKNTEVLLKSAGEGTSTVVKAASESFSPIQNFLIATLGYNVWIFVVYFTASILILMILRRALCNETAKIILEIVPRVDGCITKCIDKNSALLVSGVSIAFCLSMATYAGLLPEATVDYVEKFNHVLIVFTGLLFIGGKYARLYSKKAYRQRVGNPVIIKKIWEHCLAIIMVLYTTSLYEFNLGKIGFTDIAVNDALWYSALGASSVYIWDLLKKRHIYIGRKGALLEFVGVGGKVIVATVRQIGIYRIQFTGTDGRIISKPTRELTEETFDVLTGRDFYIERPSFVISNQVYVEHGFHCAKLAKECIVEALDLSRELESKVFCRLEPRITPQGEQVMVLSTKYPIPRQVYAEKKDTVVWKLDQFCKMKPEQK